MQYIISVLFLFFTISSQSQKLEKSLWLGGKSGLTSPTNISWGNERLGFNDVSSSGFTISHTGKWYYSKRITLGYDVGFTTQRGDELFWEVRNYGSAEANYKTLQFLAEANYFFSHDDVNFYSGIAFGGYYLINSVVFESFTNGLNGNDSFEYTEKQWQPGFGPQIGLLINLSPKAALDLQTRFTFIPSLDPHFSEEQVDQTPHGHQNQFNFTLGLWFRL